MISSRTHIDLFNRRRMETRCGNIGDVEIPPAELLHHLFTSFHLALESVLRVLSRVQTACLLIRNSICFSLIGTRNAIRERIPSGVGSTKGLGRGLLWSATFVSSVPLLTKAHCKISWLVISISNPEISVGARSTMRV